MKIDIEKMTAKELIKLVDDTFNGKFGECGESYMTLPSGRIIYSIDYGFAYDWWEKFKEDITNSRCNRGDRKTD